MGATPPRAALSPALDGAQLVRGAGRFALAYVILLVAWPALRPLYAPLFRGGAELALGVVDPFDGEIRAHFDGMRAEKAGVLAEDMPGMDTVIRLEHLRLSGAEGRAGASSFFHGYHPTAVLLALFLGATALPWSRRRPRLLLALLGLHVFIAGRCVMGAYYAFSRSTIGGHPVREFSALGQSLLYWSWHFLWEEPVATYLVPLGLWGLCVFASRTKDTPEAARAGRRG